MLTLEKVMFKPQAEILFKKEKIFNKDHSWNGQKQIIFDWFIAYFVFVSMQSLNFKSFGRF